VSSSRSWRRYLTGCPGTSSVPLNVGRAAFADGGRPVKDTTPTARSQRAWTGSKQEHVARSGLALATGLATGFAANALLQVHTGWTNLYCSPCSRIN
jgi:hypothetical protein